MQNGIKRNSKNLKNERSYDHENWHRYWVYIELHNGEAQILVSMFKFELCCKVS